MEVIEVGSKLREARVARGLSLDDIAGVTKVPKSMLTLLEGDAYGSMPAPVFVRGFIRSYAKVVGIDPNPVVRAYEQRTASLEAMAESAPPPRLPPPTSRRTGVDERPGAESPRDRSARLATERKLTPLEPVSERREGSFRGGYALLAVVAIGLLIAAWLMVGGKRPQSDASARATGVSDPRGPAIHDRIDGVPSLEAPRARAGLGGGDRAGDEVPRVR